ncbi:MAG: hypothetical protein PCFJNLEI_00934 [Verrucomicrobiae bacterium]|nr:hypothetical protein [Verrucomicrobiae bacterium]
MFLPACFRRGNVVATNPHSVFSNLHHPAPLHVQYDLDGDLFTVEGMRAADARLKILYGLAGNESAHTGQFYPGSHKLDLPMQTAAIAWLKAV